MLAAPVGVEPGLGGVTFVVPDDFWGDNINPRLVDGRFPVGVDEVAMTESTAEYGFAVGDVVNMELITFETLQTCREGTPCVAEPAGRVTITGMLRLSGDLTVNPFAQAVFVAPLAFGEDLGLDRVTTGVVTDLSAVEGVDAETLVRDYSNSIADGDIQSAERDVAGARRAGDLQHDALLVASGLVAAAGLLIAGQAFVRFLRSNDSSTLAGIGMTSQRRTIAAWFPGLIAALLGGVLVIPIAITLSPLFPQQVARRADPDVGVHAEWMVIGSGVGITALVGITASLVAAALWAVRSSTTRPVAGVSWAMALAQKLRLSPAPAMGSGFALHADAGPRRTPVFAALAATTMTVTVVVGALVLTSSLDGLLTTPSRYGANWDIQALGGEQTEALGAQIAQDDRVDGVAVAASSTLGVARAGDEPLQGYAIGMSSIKGSVEPVILEGRAPVGLNEVLLGTETVDLLGVAVGDGIVVTGPNGEQSMVVVGRALMPVLSSDRSGDGVIVPLETWFALGGADGGADIDVEAAVFVTVTDVTDIDAVEGDIEVLGAVIDGPFRPGAVSVLDEVRAIPLFVAALIAFLGAFALFHVLAVTARRRRTDLATARALGFRPRDAGSVLCWQGVVAALTAVVIGVPAGLISGRLLWTSIANRNNVPTFVDVPAAQIVALVVIVLVAGGFVLAAGPAWNVSKRHPAADLRAE